METPKMRRPTNAQIGIILSILVAIVLLLIPYTLKSMPDFMSTNQSAFYIRENVNMSLAYVLIVLIPLIIIGGIWAYVRAGKKTDIEDIKEMLATRLDNIEKKIEDVKNDQLNKG